MNKLSLLIIDRLTPYIKYDISTLREVYNNDHELSSLSSNFNEVSEAFFNLIRNGMLDDKGDGYSLSKKGEMAYKAGQEREQAELKRNRFEESLSKSTLTTNNATTDNYEWNRNNSKKQNLLTGINIVIALFAVFISFLANKNSKNDSDFVRKKDLQKEIRISIQEYFKKLDSLKANGDLKEIQPFPADSTKQ